jgi:hypothetical protein
VRFVEVDLVASAVCGGGAGAVRFLAGRRSDSVRD